MANVNEIIKYFDLICQKDYTGGLSPDEKNTALKQSEIMLWKSMVGLSKQSIGSQYPNNMFYEATADYLHQSSNDISYFPLYIFHINSGFNLLNFNFN